MRLRLFSVIFSADGVSRSGPIPVAVWSLGARKSRCSVMVRHDIVCDRFRPQSDALGHDPSERSISRHFTTDYPHIRGSGAAQGGGMHFATDCPHIRSRGEGKGRDVLMPLI